MYLDGRSRLRLGAASNRLYRWLAVLFPATIVGSVFGQSYLAPPPGFGGAPAVPAMGNVTPAAGAINGQLNSQTLDQINAQANGPASSNGQQGTGTTEGGKEVTGTSPLAAPLDAIASWGAVHVHPRASYQFLYVTGIHSQAGNEADTYTHTLAPGMTLILGPHVTADYGASIRFYSEKDFHNTVDHSFSLHAGYNVGDWTLGLSQSASISDEPTVETSSQVQRSAYNTGLLASYSMNDKITLATSASMGLSYNGAGATTNIFVGGTNGAAAQLTDSQNYNLSETFDYKFNEKLSGGVSASLGYSEQAGGFRSIDENYSVHVAWHPAQKFSATLSGGIEQQNFLDSKTTSAWSPIYSANVGYQMFEHTALSLYASRSLQASVFDNQISESTAVGLGLQQRLLGKLQLTLGFGYNKVDYKSTATTDLSRSRGDENTSFTAGLTVPFLTRCSFAAFYQYTQNQSSQAGFGFDSNQVGATLSWSY
jgi:hypothetical protein